MGCQQSKSEELLLQEKQSKLVDQQLKRAKGEYLSEIKLLLLGTGESGKSTIAKQLKILHAQGFTKQEFLGFRPVVFNNTVSGMKTLVLSSKLLQIPIARENESRARKFEEMNAIEVEQMTIELAEDIKALWADPGIKETFEQRNKFQLPDGVSYFFDRVDELTNPNYIPDEQAVLRVRARTTGIVETQFKIKGTPFRLVDVGGQRSERKKWIHCFEDVTAIIYCVALNEYDMKLFEDEKVNRMEESLELFAEICNSKWFTKTAMILFLNKSDLFEEKIKKVSLQTLFPDYTGGHDYEKGVEYIQNKFANLNKNPNKKIFAHVTCATDTNRVKVVFDAAKEIIISQNLERLGFGTL